MNKIIIANTESYHELDPDGDVALITRHANNFTGDDEELEVPLSPPALKWVSAPSPSPPPIKKGKKEKKKAVLLWESVDGVV